MRALRVTPFAKPSAFPSTPVGLPKKTDKQILSGLTLHTKAGVFPAKGKSGALRAQEAETKTGIQGKYERFLTDPFAKNSKLN